jgi:hypothetical protein
MGDRPLASAVRNLQREEKRCRSASSRTPAIPTSDLPEPSRSRRAERARNPSVSASPRLVFSFCSDILGLMRDDLDKLTPATEDDLTQALAFALEFDGRKRFRASGELMARITAAHLVRYLRQSGYVVMKKPPIGGHSQLAGGPPD